MTSSAVGKPRPQIIQHIAMSNLRDGLQLLSDVRQLSLPRDYQLVVVTWQHEINS
jgi:hypothetical protein